MKIYLVENVGNSPGKIQAIFASRTDAEEFRDLVSMVNGHFVDSHTIVERTLFYGHPNNRGFNE
jgi:hypothetical protein